MRYIYTVLELWLGDYIITTQTSFLFNPFRTNLLVVVYGMGGPIRPPPNISAPEGAKRLIFLYDVQLSKIYH